MLNEIDDMLAVSSGIHDYNLCIWTLMYFFRLVFVLNISVLTPIFKFRFYNFTLQKPLAPVERYRAIRDSQFIGLSGYSNEVRIRVKTKLKQVQH